MNPLNSNSSETLRTGDCGAVYVLRISHRHGDNLEAHGTEESAFASLYQYVAQEWDDGVTEQYGALEHFSIREAIDAYFECCGNALDPEYYELQKLPILSSGG